jgi:hypothetical protein
MERRKKGKEEIKIWVMQINKGERKKKAKNSMIKEAQKKRRGKV